MRNQKNNSKPKIAAIDLFCGAGGLTRGLLDAGIQVVMGIDADLTFKDTYEKNNIGVRFFHKKIEDVSGNEISNFCHTFCYEKLLLAACAPCQPFSRHNKKNVMEGYKDKRKNLLLHVVRIIKEMHRKPDYIFMENVPGLQHKESHVFAQFKGSLKKFGYKFVDGIKNAANYGVPQNRKRLILLARRGKIINFPEETHGRNKEPYLKVENALKSLPTLKAGGKSRKIPNHWTRKLSPLNLERLRNIPKNGGSRNSLKGRLVLKCHRKTNGHRDVYGRMAWDKVAPTLTCKCISLSNGRFGHPSQNRAISVREAARLQTFPDDYIFYGTGLESEAKQVGNAVPVKLASVFGKHIASLKDEKN